MNVNIEIETIRENITALNIPAIDLDIMDEILNQQRGECIEGCKWIPCYDDEKINYCPANSILSAIDAAMIEPGIMGERMKNAYEEIFKVITNFDELEGLPSLLIDGVWFRFLSLNYAQLLADTDTDSFLYLAEDTAEVRRELEKDLVNIKNDVKQFWIGIFENIVSLLGF